MAFDARLQEKDWKAVIWVGLTLVGTAWIMAILDVVYAPIPMFAASVVAGYLYRGHPRQASMGGALAGLLGGWLAEWAFHTVRLQNRLFNWSQMDSNEQLGLAVAEMLLYAALLSFFSAFFSWGISSDSSHTADHHPEEKSSPYANKTGQPHVDIPIFKKDPAPGAAAKPPEPPVKK